MSEFIALFRALPRPETHSGSGLSLNGIPISGSSHHIAKNAEGCPVILLSVVESDLRPASLVLRNLQLEHALRCRIRNADGSCMDGRFSVLRCQSANKLLHEYFLELVSSLLRALPLTPTAQEVSEAIDRMASLFLALERPATRTVQGLWGELFLIERSLRPVFLVDAWHRDACDRYDFASDAYRLEVKTSGDRSRSHYFSFEQVHAPPGVGIAVASLFTEKAAVGPTLGELWDSVRAAVTDYPALRLKVDEVCIQSLGESWQEARMIKFDSSIAGQSLAFFDVADIPRPQADQPLGLSEIRFRSDLAFGRTIQEANRLRGALVEAILG